MKKILVIAMLCSSACATANQLDALALAASATCAAGDAVSAAGQPAGAVVSAATCWWADYLTSRADGMRDRELDAAARKLEAALAAEEKSRAESGHDAAVADVARAHESCLVAEARARSRS